MAVLRRAASERPTSGGGKAGLSRLGMAAVRLLDHCAKPILVAANGQDSARKPRPRPAKSAGSAGSHVTSRPQNLKHSVTRLVLGRLPRSLALSLSLSLSLALSPTHPPNHRPARGISSMLPPPSPCAPHAPIRAR